MTNVTDGFEPVPPDAYLLTVTAVEEKPGKKFPYLNWTMEIVNGEYAGKKVFHMTTLSPDALFGLKAFLRAFAYDVDGEVSFEPEELIGKEAWADLKIDKYLPEGEDADDPEAWRKSNKIKKFHKPEAA